MALALLLPDAKYRAKTVVEEIYGMHRDNKKRRIAYQLFGRLDDGQSHAGQAYELRIRHYAWAELVTKRCKAGLPTPPIAIQKCYLAGANAQENTLYAPCITTDKERATGEVYTGIWHGLGDVYPPHISTQQRWMHRIEYPSLDTFGDPVVRDSELVLGWVVALYFKEHWKWNNADRLTTLVDLHMPGSQNRSRDDKQKRPSRIDGA